MESLESVVSAIAAKQEELTKEITKFSEKGNKAAGQRARKISLELEKLYKSFRKLSVK
ncbi:histone H1 [Tenacibaculum sp.]|uniref:histone H1 n=1 Tax=Tenacibaculum sp. TaxID=1906242 RepID=UPI003D0B3F9A